MLLRRRAGTWLLVPVLALLSASCTNSVDIKNSLEVTETSSGWFDAGIVAGKNKIVPSVSFRLRKKADVDLETIALNVVFRHPPPDPSTAAEDWDEVYVQSAQFEGPQTDLLTIRAEKGYTGDPPQSRLDILKHSQFRDVRAHVFAKHSASQWIELAAIDVQRQLIVK